MHLHYYYLRSIVSVHRFCVQGSGLSKQFALFAGTACCRQRKNLALITSLSFQTGTPGSIQVIANNTGTTVVTINEVWVNNAKQTTMSPALPSNVNANAGLALNITINVAAGYAYQVKLVSSKGNQFLYTGTAPT